MFSYSRVLFYQNDSLPAILHETRDGNLPICCPIAGRMTRR